MIRKLNEYYSRLYFQIDWEEYDQLISSGSADWSSIEKEVIYRYKDMSSSRHNSNIHSGSHSLFLFNFVCSFDNPSENDVHFIYGKYTFVINKYYDDWFGVRVNNRMSYEDTYFKCDQIDGLKEFLGDSILWRNFLRLVFILIIILCRLIGVIRIFF